jgi:hypothetical protein
MNFWLLSFATAIPLVDAASTTRRAAQNGRC